MSDLERLSQKLDQFVSERQWGPFHTPRNLALALGGEVGELQAELQWLDEGGPVQDWDSDLRVRVEDEVADVFIYLLLFAKSCDIDLVAAASAKINRNESRFPALLRETGEAREP